MNNIQKKIIESFKTKYSYSKLMDFNWDKFLGNPIIRLKEKGVDQSG